MVQYRLLSLGMVLAGLACLPSLSAMADLPMKIDPKIETATAEKCLTILRTGLQSEEFWPSMHAAEALTQSGHGAEVLDALKGRLEKETDLRRRCGLAREQVRAGDRSKVAELRAVLANPDSYGHVHACESLYKVHEAGDLQLLQTAMADETAPVKALMAAAALARQGNPEAISFIRAQLLKNDLQSSWVAGWLLGTLGDDQDLPALKAALATAQTPRNQAFFENALGMLGDAAGQQALLKNLKSSDEGIRADAAYMTGEAGLLAGKEELISLLNDPKLDVTIRAAQGLLALNREQGAATDGTRVVISANKPVKQEPEAPVVTLQLTPGEGNSRNSEGDFIHTKDGRILFIYSYFGKGTGDDYDTAELRERVSQDGGKTWSSEERTIAKPTSGMNVMSVSLLRLASGEIALFYCAKVSHSDCRPEMRLSSDEGQTWSEPVPCVTDLIDYYVLNNSRAIQLSNGRILLPLCLHRTLATKKNDWQGELLCYLSDDNGKTWKRSESIFTGKDASGKRLTVQEPGVVELKDGKVMMFIRSNSGSQMISYSEDHGNTWSEPQTSNILSPLSPASIKRIPQTGDLILVWNDHQGIAPELKGKRTPLSVAISRDEGKTWEKTKKLYDDPNGWYCYIAIDVAEDGTVLLGHCAGDRRTNGLAITDIMRFNLAWLYGE